MLSISFEVDVPTGKVGSKLLLECQGRDLPRWGLGACSPRKFWNLDAWKCYFLCFLDSIWALKNYQNEDYVNHSLCLWQPFFSSKSQSLAFRKEWNDKSSNADSKNTFNVLSTWCPLKNILSYVCLSFFGTDTILAHAKAWDLVLWKCPRRSMTLRSASNFHRSSYMYLTRLKLLKCTLT